MIIRSVVDNHIKCYPNLHLHRIFTYLLEVKSRLELISCFSFDQKTLCCIVSCYSSIARRHEVIPWVLFAREKEAFTFFKYMYEARKRVTHKKATKVNESKCLTLDVVVTLGICIKPDDSKMRWNRWKLVYVWIKFSWSLHSTTLSVHSNHVDF